MAGMPKTILFGRSEERVFGRSNSFNEIMLSDKENLLNESTHSGVSPDNGAALLKKEDDQLVSDAKHFPALFKTLCEKPDKSPDNEYYLKGLMEDIDDGCYSHLVAVFGEATKFVNVVMSDNPNNFGSSVFVISDGRAARTFLSCTDNDINEDNMVSPEWGSTAAPALGAKVSHEIIVVLDDDDKTSFTFQLATNGVPRATGPMEDILVALVKQAIKEIALGASESECKTGIPLHVDML